MEIKHCSTCQQSKPSAEFGIYRRNKDGFRNICRECHNRKRQEYRIKNRERDRKHANQYRKLYGVKPRGRFHNLKQNCRVSGIFIDIEPDAFVEWYKNQSQACYYCGVKLINGGARNGFTSLTIDRKDNNQGYTLMNIVLACRRCNLMKGNWLTAEQMLEIAQRYFNN